MVSSALFPSFEPVLSYEYSQLRLDPFLCLKLSKYLWNSYGFPRCMNQDEDVRSLFCVPVLLQVLIV